RTSVRASSTVLAFRLLEAFPPWKLFRPAASSRGTHHPEVHRQRRGSCQGPEGRRSARRPAGRTRASGCDRTSRTALGSSRRRGQAPPKGRHGATPRRHRPGSSRRATGAVLPVGSLARLLEAVSLVADVLAVRGEGEAADRANVVVELGDQFASGDFPDPDL